jgi:hypothetical protein
MKSLLLSFFCAALLLLSGCSFFAGMGDSPPPQPAKEKVTGKFEEFTGQVIKTDEGYRFSPADAPGSLQRLTRASDSSRFADDELPMRKYFGKTLVVHGIVTGKGWIAHAQVVGQWLHPGETRGPTLTGPEPKTPQ